VIRLAAHRHRHAVFALFTIAILLIAGCAYPTGARGLNDAETAQWRGRLALRVAADSPVTQGESGAQPEAQSFSAGFELTGNAQTGSLLLFSPLGTTVAEMNWTPQTATLRTNGETRSFGSLAELLKQATGTDIPVASLFAWLAGDNVPTPGWLADLSQHALGRVVARRSDPLPAVELRLAIEK
jgi:outer membrane lipoprotein LolB